MRGLRIFLFACAVLAAFTAASLWRDRRNTLEKYPEWKSAKTDLALGVNGARSFTVTPITLLGHALNLGAWHGHQELELQDEWEEFPEVKLRVYAEGKTVWSLIAQPSGGAQALALRLSSSELHPSSWIRLGPERVFLGKEPFAYQLPNRRWVHIALRPEGGRLSAYADGAKLGSTELPPGPWRLALRAFSEEGVARVDDLSFRSLRRSYSQSFLPRYPYWLAAGLAAALFGFFLLLELMAGAGLAFGAALAFVLGSGGIWWSYDERIGNQYPDTVNLSGFPSKIESRPALLEKLHALPPGPPVLLWLGGSQAWGAGASAPEKSVFGRLSAKFSSPSLEFVNGAISAATLEDQLETLRVVAARRVVKAVVITTGVNDALNPEFGRKLALVGAAVKQREAVLLLVPEPMEPPVSSFVKARHQDVVAYAEAHGISFVSLPQVFEQRADDGFLWWDFVHLSDSGAAIAADAMAAPVQELLKKLAVGKDTDKKGKRK